MKSKIFLYLALLWSMAPNVCATETHLHISTGFTAPVSGFFESVLAEADKRLKNISISFEILPAERSLVLVNQGVNDAECCRAPAVLKNEYKNLQPVDVSFSSVRFSVFSKNTRTPIKHFSDLKPYSVGSVKGWKLAVDGIKKVAPAETHIVTTPKQLMQMLEQDRLDYGVVGYLSGLTAIAELKLDSVHVIEPPLVEKPLFLILNKKHQHLIPDFNAVLTEMKNDGTISRLYRELIDAL